VELFCKKAEVRDYEAKVENPVRKMNISSVLHSSVQQKSTALCVLSGYLRAVLGALSPCEQNHHQQSGKGRRSQARVVRKRRIFIEFLSMVYNLENYQAREGTWAARTS
jgi:hypothetical protein